MSPLTLFLILCFGLSWLSMPLFFLLGGQWNGPAAPIWSMGYMWVPGLCAIGIAGASHGSLMALGLNWRPNRWWLVAWLLPPLLALASLGVALLLPGVSFSPRSAALFERLARSMDPAQIEQLRAALGRLPVPPLLLALLQGLIGGATLNALAALGEELAWRGLLHTELGHLHFWKGSVLIGAIWGLWHAPLILQGHNYPEHSHLGVGMMILWCLLLAPLFSWIRIKGASIWAVALLHGTINGTLGISLMLLAGGSDLLIGMTGLAGLIVLATVDLALFLAQPRLRRATLAELSDSL